MRNLSLSRALNIFIKFFIFCAFIDLSAGLTPFTPLPFDAVKIEKKLKEFYSGKRVLVTGGAGFIGSHLVDKLIEYGAQVTVLDNFSTGAINNLKNACNHVTILYSDITNQESVFTATKDKDVVFHFAAFISVPLSIKEPERCYKINIDGTKNLLEGCRANKVPVFIFSSSCAVYGDSDKILTEESPLAPISPYAQSKIAGETLCKEYSHLGIHAVALRYFNVYGDRQDPSGYYAAVVSKFSYNLEHKLPLIIFGDGTQTRDFVHVSYIVLANLIMGMYPADGDIFNIASGKSINLFQLISYLEKIYGQNTAGINFKPKRAGDILHVTASGEKFLNYVKKIFT